MWKFEDMMEYSKQLAKDIFSGKITIEEAVIKDFEQTGISKDKARKILNELLSNSANRKPIKSGTSNFGSNSEDTNRIYQFQFDYIITNDDSVEDADDRILHKLESIDGITLEGNPGINNDYWTVEDYGLTTPENLEYFVEMPKDGLVHLYVFDFSINNNSGSSSPEDAFDKIYNEVCMIDGIYVVNGMPGDDSWSREEYGITSSRKPIKSGFSNNPDYVGDWFGKGQIDFNAIINPEDSGDVYMVKMWSGAGYVLDVYLCKATNIYDAMDIVFNWSWEHEGENNIVFDFDYVRNEAAEYYKSDPDMFGENIDEQEFEDLFISEYYVSNDYSLFARSENFFVDKVPENVLAENQNPIENSRRPIKSMAAVSKNNRMDFKSLQNMAGMYLDREGIKFTENNKGLHVDQFGDIIITAEPAGKTNRSEGRYSIELIPNAGDNDTYALFENAENDYYEGSSVDEFQEDMEDILREIFDVGRDNMRSIALSFGEDYDTNDLDTCYQFMLDAYPEFKVFVEDNEDVIKNNRKPVKSGLLDKAKGESVEQYREDIKRDVSRAIDDVIYNYQEKLGITTGDSWTVIDDDRITDEIITILKEQLEYFM